MSYEATLYSLLSPLVGGRVYPDMLTTQQDGAYIIWQQVGGEEYAQLSGEGVELLHARVQVACWAGSRLAANALVRQVKAAMLAGFTPPPQVFGAPVSQGNEDLRLYGAIQDFGVWYVE